MRQHRKAQVVTLVILALAVAIALGRQNGWRITDPRSFRLAPPPSAPEPQDTVYAMLNAARAGDVNAYLAAYTGSMEASLRQSLAESNAADFAKYLRDSTASLKGAAVAE